MPVALVSDSCHYLPRALVDSNRIHEVSLYVHHDGEADRESAITDYDAYYRRLADLTSLPTTSQPSIGDFLEVYEPLIAAGNEVVRSTYRVASRAPIAPHCRRASSSAMTLRRYLCSTRRPRAAVRA